MSVSWDASELNALAADLGQAGYRATRKAQQVVAKAALDVEARAKVFAPVPRSEEHTSELQSPS